MKNYYLLMLLAILIHMYKANAQKNADKDSIIAFTQQLINGIANGDTTAWSKYLDDSCIITSEDGSVKTKKQFINGIKAPPSFIKVMETISNSIFRSNTGTIIFIYTANLSLYTYGQERLNEICQTDTWFKTTNGWRLISSEALDKPEIPTPQKINPAIIATLTGLYKLSDGSDFKIFIREGKLYSRQSGGKENELKCESDYTYFIESKPLLRYIFTHDENNKIRQLISRRAGRDFVFSKTD